MDEVYKNMLMQTLSHVYQSSTNQAMWKCLDEIPVDSRDIARYTQRDVNLSKVLQYTLKLNSNRKKNTRRPKK